MAAEKKKIPTFQGFKSNGIEKVIVDGYSDKIKDILGGSDELVARFNQIAVTVVSNNANIKKCSQNSIIGSILQASILKLNPAPTLGLCAFVPFFNSDLKVFECQFQIQYQGWINLAYRSSRVQDVYAEIRYEKDKFELQLGSTPKITHIPYLDGDRGSRLGAYAVWHLVGAKYPHIEYMTMAEIDIIRKESLSKVSASGKKVVWPSMKCYEHKKRNKNESIFRTSKSSYKKILYTLNGNFNNNEFSYRSLSIFFMDQIYLLILRQKELSMNKIDLILLILCFFVGFASIALYQIYTILLEIRDKSK